MRFVIAPTAPERRFTRTGTAGLASTVVAVAAGVVLMAPPAMSVEEPSDSTAKFEISVATERFAPGDQITFEAGPCDVRPELRVSPVGGMIHTEMQDRGDGMWTDVVEAPEGDLRVAGTCGDVEAEVFWVDVFNPVLSFTEFTGTYWGPDGPDHVYGNDCPSATTVSVTISRDGSVSTHEVESGTDGRWRLPIGSTRPGQTVRVEATCGDITYEPISATRPAGGGGDPDESTPTTAPTPSPAAPAQPREAAPTYTG